jgi:Secretion system C-terminal sorting domain
MKHLLNALFFFLIQSTQAQNDLKVFIHLNGTNNLPIGGHARVSEHLPDQNTIILGLNFWALYAAYPSGTNFIKDVANGDRFTLIAHNYKTNTQIEKRASAFNDQVADRLGLLGIAPKGDSLLFGMASADDQGKRLFCFNWTNAKLDLLGPGFCFEPDSLYTYSTTDMAVTADGNILFHIIDKNEPYPNYHVIKLDQTGKLLGKSARLNTSDDLILNGGGISEVFDSLYYVRPYYLINSDLKLICSSQVAGLQTGDNAVSYGDKLYFAGKTSQPSVNSMEEFTTKVQSLDLNCTGAIVFQQIAGTGRANDFSVVNDAIDLHDLNHIYLTDERDGGWWLEPSNAVTISSVTQTGDLNWHYRYEIAQSLHPVGVYALPDETVLFLVGGMDMMNGLSMDIYAVRLDKQGQVVSTKDLKLEDEHTASYLLTPNPATDQLFLSMQIATPIKYTVFDLQGNSWLKGSGLGSHQIDISQLPVGVYYLQIESDKGKITTLKPFVAL